MNSSGISLTLSCQEPSPQAGETAHGSMLGPAGALTPAQALRESNHTGSNWEILQKRRRTCA